MRSTPRVRYEKTPSVTNARDNMIAKTGRRMLTSASFIPDYPFLVRPGCLLLLVFRHRCVHRRPRVDHRPPSPDYLQGLPKPSNRSPVHSTSSQQVSRYL